MSKPRLRLLRPRVTNLVEPRLATLPRQRTQRLRGRRAVERRKAWLADHPACERCEAMTPRRFSVAEEVDHVVPLYAGGADDETNFSSLCKDCHRAKSAEDIVTYGVPR